MEKSFDLFMENPYWKNIYDSAPSDEAREYYRIMFEYFSFETDKNDSEIDAANERLMDIMLTRQDAEYIKNNSGMAIARHKYSETIRELFEEEQAETVSASFFKGEIRNPHYHPVEQSEGNNGKEKKMKRIIKVTGTGKIHVKPDTIRLNIGAEDTCKEYGEAIKKSTEDTALLRDAMEKVGLKREDLKTVRFRIDSAYESYRDRNNNLKSKFVGYKYNHDMYIQFQNDNNLLGKALYELANCPTHVEFSIMHTVRDTEAAKNELLGKAVEDSRIKADVLSKAAGVKLGEIKTIDYSWGEMEIYSEPMGRKLLLEDCELADSYNIDIEADDIDVRDTVTVVWEIE